MKYFLAFLMTILVCASDNQSNGDKSLQMVHLLYRHGARSPRSFYPNDKYQEKDWPDGAGRLTQKGMQLEYDLGIFLRERYITQKKFISSLYRHKEIYARSSNVERCLQSAETQLAGLYPPKGYQVWNTHIPWQPVPVHTVPKDEDVLLRSNTVYCPRLLEIFEEKKKSPEFLKKYSDHKQLFAKLSNYTGMKVTLENIDHITDPITCEKTEGLKIPKWANELWSEMMNVSHWKFVYFFSGNDEIGKLLGGPLLEKINENMKQMSESKDTNSLFKFNIFSGHDSSMLSLTAALNIHIDVPVYAACIMIELHYSSSKGYTVELWYRKDYSGNVQPLKLKQCEFSCPLTAFLNLTKNRVTKDRSIDCKIDRKFLTSNDWKLLLLPTVLGMALLFLLVCVSANLYFLTRKSVFFMRKLRCREMPYFDDEQKLIKPSHI